MSLSSLKDLNGKKISVAAPGSGTQVSARIILNHYGIKAKEYELDIKNSTQRLANGQLDGFFYNGGTPFSALVQLAATTGFELYKFSAEERQEINRIIPYYVESTIPAGTYKNISYDVPTVAINGQLVTSVQQPAELVYNITKALWNENTRNLLDKGHSKGSAIQMKSALKGILIPLHPGAEKFYKEQGMIK